MVFSKRIWNAINLCEKRDEKEIQARIEEVKEELELLQKELQNVKCEVPDFQTRIGRLAFLVLRKEKRTYWRDSGRTIGGMWESTSCVNWDHD